MRLFTALLVLSFNVSAYPHIKVEPTYPMFVKIWKCGKVTSVIYTGERPGVHVASLERKDKVFQVTLDRAYLQAMNHDMYFDMDLGCE